MCGEFGAEYPSQDEVAERYGNLTLWQFELDAATTPDEADGLVDAVPSTKAVSAPTDHYPRSDIIAFGQRMIEES